MLYESDCVNYFSGGGGGYPTGAEACQSQNCTPSYVLGGSCSNAPNNQDGNGYVSDSNGYNYYFESPANPQFDAQTAQQACQNPGQYTYYAGPTPIASCSGLSTNTPPQYVEQGGNNNGMSASEINMINSAISGGMSGVNQAEYFTLFPKEGNTSHYMLLAIILILCAALGGYFMYTRGSKPSLAFKCG